LFYGKGAGSEPTASAVIADLIDLTRLMSVDPKHRVPHLAFHPDAMSPIGITPMDLVLTSYYLRLRVSDRAGVLAEVTGVLATEQISIDAVLQRPAGTVLNQTDLIIMTHECEEGRMNRVISKLSAIESVHGDIVRIRKEELS